MCKNIELLRIYNKKRYIFYEKRIDYHVQNNLSPLVLLFWARRYLGKINIPRSQLVFFHQFPKFIRALRAQTIFVQD